MGSRRRASKRRPAEAVRKRRAGGCACGLADKRASQFDRDRLPLKRAPRSTVSGPGATTSTQATTCPFPELARSTAINARCSPRIVLIPVGSAERWARFRMAPCVGRIGWACPVKAPDPDSPGWTIAGHKFSFSKEDLGRADLGGGRTPRLSRPRSRAPLSKLSNSSGCATGPRVRTWKIHNRQWIACVRNLSAERTHGRVDHPPARRAPLWPKRVADCFIRLSYDAWRNELSA